MRVSTVLAVLAVSVSGCAPGYSLKPVSATPSGITIEYTHSISSEYPAAVQSAEQHCQRFGKHARPVGQPVQLNIDRSVATFECAAASH